MHQVLEHGIYCIDAGYVRPRNAACYLMVHGGEAAIIETGTSKSLPRVLETLDAAGLAPAQVRYVIPTHVHLDHAGGAGALMAACPAATLLIHPRGARHMIDPTRLIAGTIEVYGQRQYQEMYGQITPIPQHRVRIAEDGSRWDLGGRELLIRDTPGHARHHFCVWDELSRGWFSGDTFGVCYPELAPFFLPTTTPVQFEPEVLCISIDLLMSFAPAHCYLTHFGRVPALAEHATALKEQICDYARLATRYDDAEALYSALTAYTLERLRQLQPYRKTLTLPSFLSDDMALNTQGLMHWKRNLRAAG